MEFFCHFVTFRSWFRSFKGKPHTWYHTIPFIKGPDLALIHPDEKVKNNSLWCGLPESFIHYQWRYQAKHALFIFYFIFCKRSHCYWVSYFWIFQEKCKIYLLLNLQDQITIGQMSAYELNLSTIRMILLTWKKPWKLVKMGFIQDRST